MFRFGEFVLAYSFIDRTKIRIRSGKGGDGHVSFHREKFVANGGPDGGDGGNGGNVIFEVDPGMNSLSMYRHRMKFSAKDGEDGGKSRCHGKNGEDIILKVPKGTVIYDDETGKVISDMSGDNLRQIILKGGKGGLGNMHFATSRMQVPKFSTPGGEAVETMIRLELKMIADIGLVGFPNAGKSTLISVLTNAKPEIADYPFTTLSPIPGVMDTGDGRSVVIADIPGLIEGASEGVGLGHEFLRHIQRTKILLQLVDPMALDEGRNIIDDIKVINNELSKYDDMLLKKPMIIALSKADCLTSEEKEEKLSLIRNEFPDYEAVAFSSQSKEGLNELKDLLIKAVEKNREEEVVFESEFDPMELSVRALSYEVRKNEEGEYEVMGPKIDRLLGYTNLDSEKGFNFFQKFFENEGIIKDMKALGMKEGDTVNVGGYLFTYYE